MPSGIHSGVRTGNRSPRIVCDCGKCKNCKFRAWKRRTGRVGGDIQEVYDKKINFEARVDAEPSFDVLTERLIEKFRMRGWD